MKYRLAHLKSKYFYISSHYTYSDDKLNSNKKSSVDIKSGKK